MEAQFNCLLLSFGSPSFRAKNICLDHRDTDTEIAPFQPTCPIAPNPDTGKSQKTRDSRLSSFVLSLSDPVRVTRNYGRSLVRFTILVVCSLAVSLATLVVRFATLVARSEVSRLPSFAHSIHETLRSISNSRRSICYSVYHFNRVKVHTPLQIISWTH